MPEGIVGFQEMIMIRQLLWLLFWPISQLFSSPEDAGIELTQISWKWAAPILAPIILFYVCLVIYSKHHP
jgi:hypothetical protein